MIDELKLAKEIATRRRQEKEAIDLITKTDMFYSDIAKQVGLSQHIIRNLSRRLNLRPAPPDAEEQWRQHEEAKALAAKMLSDGWSVKATAAETGLSACIVGGISRQPEVVAMRAACDVYIYALCCPLSRQAFYVGSAENPWKRLYEHCRASHSDLVCEWVAELREFGKSPQLKILDHAHTSDRFGLERQWIERLVSAGHPLMNREAQ